MVTYCGREHQRLAPAFTCRQHMPLDILSNPHENIHKQVGLSSMRSASSRTMWATWDSEIRPPSTKWFRRPGVAISTSQPLASSLICEHIALVASVL